MVKQDYTPYRQIAGKLNIQQGDQVLLTSDILKLAIKSKKSEKEFDVNAFLDSFMEAVGHEGTLLIPSYNFDLENGDAYNILETTPMTGSLAVTALNRDDFIRTDNPLHSFLVKGKDVPLLAELDNVSSFGPDSPFAYLKQKNALLIFAGTTVAEAMTFTHFVEETEKVGYRKYKSIKVEYTDRLNKLSARYYKIYSKKPGWTMKLDKLEEELSKHSLTTVQINGIAFSFIRSSDAFDVIRKDIKENNASSIVAFSFSLYIRDIIKEALQRFNIFRTTYGKIRSGKRLR
jgi:aminoglycoside 3-N-acetyltransferase